MPLPGIQRDAVTIQRPAQTVSAEGDTTGPLATVITARGTLGMPSMTDSEVAAQRGQTINSVLAIEQGIDVRDGDLLTVRGKTYTVVGVDDVLFHQRVFLRG